MNYHMIMAILLLLYEYPGPAARQVAVQLDLLAHHTDGASYPGRAVQKPRSAMAGAFIAARST